MSAVTVDTRLAARDVEIACCTTCCCVPWLARRDPPVMITPDGRAHRIAREMSDPVARGADNERIKAIIRRRLEGVSTEVSMALERIQKIADVDLNAIDRPLTLSQVRRIEAAADALIEELRHKASSPPNEGVIRVDRTMSQFDVRGKA